MFEQPSPPEPLPPPPLPTVNLKKLLALREKLYGVCLSFAGESLVGETLGRLAGRVHREMLSCRRDALSDSLRSVAGQTMVAALAEEVSWRLAGNLHRLRAGVTVPPWTHQYDREWAPFEVVRVRKRRRAFKPRTEAQALQAGRAGVVHRRGVVARCFFFAGTAAGLYADRFWTAEYCETVRFHFGFDRRNRERYSRNVSRRASYPFTDVTEFFQMRAFALLEPELCKGHDLGFSELRGTGATKAWCRAIMRKRLRDDFVCPEGFPDGFACAGCPFGRGTCPAACHAEDYRVGDCEGCHSTDCYLDPDGGFQLCLDCAANQS